jgi:hypothetical protein
MVQHAGREPTMDEIVVALRETRRGANRAQPFNVVGRRSGNRPAAAGAGSVTYTQNWIAGATEAADLRDGETERLLTENARLNERIVFLLKIIERDQMRAAEHAAVEAEREAVFRDMKAALKAELRPALLVLLRMLEKGMADPGGALAAGQTRRDTPSPWIVDLIHKLDGDDADETARDPLILPRQRPSLRQRLGRFFHALGF